MKILTLLLLSSFSLTALAELSVDETNTITGNQGSITIAKKSIIEVENTQSIDQKKIVEDQISQKIEELKVKEVLPEVKTESESLVTSSDTYSLFLTPSQNAQTYSLKVTKDNKIYFNSKFYATPVNYEHKIQLVGGIGTYKIEYIEYDSTYSSKNKIFAKIINLVYKIPELIKNIKTSKWVQANDPRIKSLASSITKGIKGEYQKVLAIDDWITKNIEYNYTSTMMSQDIDAITTLEMRMGICTGYANLFAALARASGLEAKAITGKAKFDGKSYYHQWNEVLIDGTWYFIDPTWNAGRKRRDFFTKVSDYPETYKSRKEVKIY